MLVNKDAYQRETLTEWPIGLPLILNLNISRELGNSKYFYTYKNWW